MSNLMYCPMTMIDKQGQIHECTPECAWAIRIKNGTEYACAKALEATYQDNVNSRPLEEEADVS